MAIKIFSPKLRTRVQVECSFCFFEQPVSTRSLGRVVQTGRRVKCRECGEWIPASDLQIAYQRVKETDAATPESSPGSSP